MVFFVEKMTKFVASFTDITCYIIFVINWLPQYKPERNRLAVGQSFYYKIPQSCKQKFKLPVFYISVSGGSEPNCTVDNDVPIISDFICPFSVNNQQINTLHIKACDSDPFEPNEDYLGLALWNHKIHGMTYDLGIKKIRAAQLVIKKTRNVLDLSTKSPHVNLFKV